MDGQLQPIQSGYEMVSGCSFQYVDLHQIFCGIVEDQADEVERSDCREALREVPKERGQVAVRHDGFGHLEEKP